MFGEVVRGHRRRLGLTQEELAERTGISVRGIRNLEAGRIRRPRMDTLRVLADVFELEGAERERLLVSSPSAARSKVAVPNDQEAMRFSLPPDTIAFTGRTAELDAITATVAQIPRQGGVVAIHAIDGMPGIGKTTLAVHAAHQLADRYPDGQIFLDLRAHLPGLPPTDPADALADLLRASGIDPHRLPGTLEARTALWRDRMTGRRVLLVLDNVESTGQVSPLLPGSDTVLVLITSRRRLGDLRHASHLHLMVPSRTEAIEMFVRLAPRAADEPEAVAELAGMCEYLPLAMAILASRYAAHPTWTMADLLAELRDHRDRLLTVKSEDVTVHAAFDLSYQQLPAKRQRFFRLLGLTPGVDLDGYAAAALTGTTLEEADEHLDRLYNDHLLEETAPRRYRMHDLIRAYTRTHATTTERDHVCRRAIDRLLDYYQHTAHRADALIARYTRPGAVAVAAPVAAPDLPDGDHALAWLRAERENLQACLHHASAGDEHHRVVGLTAGLAALLYRDGPWTQAVALHQNAAAAATHAGDLSGYAGALRDLGIVRRLTGDYHAADDLLHQALNTYTEIGDRHGQATTLTDLGRVRQAVGDYPAGDRLLRQVLTIYTEIGDRRGQATTAHNLGIGRRLVGDYPAADDLLHHALNTYTEIGDRRGQANTLHELGIVQWLVGDYPAADDVLHQALTTYTEIGDRRGQANTLHELGIVRRLVGDHPAATDLLHQALTTYTEIGSRHGRALTWTQLGMVRCLTGDHPGAEDQLQRALTALREIGAPDDEAEALNHLGVLRRLTGHPDQALAHHTEALTLARRIHHRLEEAHALEGIGRATLDLGDPATATTHLRGALWHYQQLGVPEAEAVTAILADQLSRQGNGS